MTVAELARLAEELGIDVVGAARAEPYAETERHIRDRRARGLFADMRFTMARPEVSCHPERLLANARTVISAALCYYAEGPETLPGEGRLPRYAWRDHYAELREKLERLGRLLGGSYRVLVDANHHVDRAGAARSGVGFIGKNTMLITERHGSWVVLGTLVTDVEVEPTAPLGTDCGSCRLCIDACPTDAIVEPGVLDAGRCLAYWTQAPHPIPEGIASRSARRCTAATSARMSAPGTAASRSRRSQAPRDGAAPTVSLVDWLERDAADLVGELDRLYVPKNDARWLRRNALVALGNSGRPEDAPAVEQFVGGGDPILAETAEWALGRIAERSG